MSINDDRIKKLANKWCLHPTDNAWDEVMGFAYDLIADEREACAKVAESYEPTCDSCPSGVAIAIRSRGIDGAKVAEVGIWGEK